MSKPLSPAAQRWGRLLKLHAQSGLSLRAFAEQQGVNVSTLAWWKSRLAAPDAPTFLPVHVVEPPRPAAGSIEILTPGGHVIRVQGDLDVGALRHVLSLLERSS